MRVGGLLAIVCAVALLSGCTASPFGEQTLLTSDVPADAPAAFLEDPIEPGTELPAGVAAAFSVDPARARLQGSWRGEEVYLYDTSGTVWMLGYDPDAPDTWHAGGSVGNVAFAWESGDTTDDQWTLQYLPQGTADLPEGWTAFSPWIAAREF